jgi:hypothetical protein
MTTTAECTLRQQHTTPCADCPFRRQSECARIVAPYLDVAKVFNYPEGGGRIPCHTRVDAIRHTLMDEEGREPRAALTDAMELAPECAGAVAFANNAGRRSDDPDAARLQDSVGKREDVFASPGEMVRHHQMLYDYAQHPRRPEVLPRLSREVLADLHAGRLDAASLAADPRPMHRRLFLDLTPPGTPYLAGHYRGEDFDCLRDYNVGAFPDLFPGAPEPMAFLDAAHVPKAMADFSAKTVTACRRLDAGELRPGLRPGTDFLFDLVLTACGVYSEFLYIHPFAYGNGHVARVLLTAALGRYGYWLRRFPIEPSPPRRYHECVRLHQDGKVEPLFGLVLGCLVP